MFMRRLSRYVLKQWIKIFLLAAIGLPVISVMVYLTDRLKRLIQAGLTFKGIAMVGLYAIPGNTAIMIPAASLFATVFTVGPMARNSEITAAKAGGVSFRRLIFPTIIASMFSAFLCFWVTEKAPESTKRQIDLEQKKPSSYATWRPAFTYLADAGWTYSFQRLDARSKTVFQPILERAPVETGGDRIAITADSGKWNDSTGRWRLIRGAVFFHNDTAPNATTVGFDTVEVADFNEPVTSLLIEPKAPEEMTYRELEKFIESRRRSATDTKKLEAELAKKLALPAASFIITLFGAPLAMSNPRAGVAWGIAVSMGTTLIYLLLINLSIAVGASGTIDPTISAWLPNAFFLFLGLILLARVRT